MNCPTCNVALQMTDRQGVEIDYCPQCRGVWLDRGELDKIIEKAAPPSESRDNPPRETAKDARNYRDDDDDDDRTFRGDRGRRRRKEGFLGDLFDF